MSGFRKRQSVAGLQRPKGESSCCRIVWSGSSNQSTSAWREVGLRKWTSLAAPIGEQRINDLAGVYFCIDQRTQAGQRANDQRTSLLAPPFAVHLYRLRLEMCVSTQLQKLRRANRGRAATPLLSEWLLSAAPRRGVGRGRAGILCGSTSGSCRG